MKRFIFSIVAIVALSTQGIAQKKYAPTKKENSLLWEISGNGLNQSSYLYGTIHMIGAEDFFLTEKTKEFFRKSGRLALEFNMEDMMDMSNIMSLMEGAYMKNDTTLKDLMSEEDYKFVEAHFQKVGLPLGFLSRIKPMFLSAMGSGDMNQTNLQNGKVKSYEMEFVEMAKNQEKELDGLETAEYQLSIFDSIPYKVQAEMLVQTIKAESDATDKDSEGQFDELVKLYKAKDIFGLQQMLNSESGGIKGYEDILLNNRNRNWIPVMEELMSREVVFFAVGAGHLPGEEGVIALLRKKGYKVKPVKE